MGGQQLVMHVQQQESKVAGLAAGGGSAAGITGDVVIADRLAYSVASAEGSLVNADRVA
jgi:hypothetical protein